MFRNNRLLHAAVSLKCEIGLLNVQSSSRKRSRKWILCTLLMDTLLSILSYAKVYLILNNLLSGEEQDNFPPFPISLWKQFPLFPKNTLC